MRKSDYQTARTAMVDCQIRPADVTHYNVIDAMLKVPRELFFPENLREIAYIGEHVKIKDDRYALDPRVIAKILNLANVSDTDLVLNVGGCYGYLATLLSFSAQAVVLTEELEIARDAERILVEQAIDNVIVKAGPLVDGADDYGPYDVIIIEGGIEFIPETIFNQLKIGGRVVTIFIEGLVGECRLGFRTLETIDWRFGFNAVAPILRGFMKDADFVF